MRPVASPPAALAYFHPLEHGDPDLGHREARGLRAQRRPALLGVVDRRRRRRRVARGRPERGKVPSSGPAAAAVAAAVDAGELAVEGVKVPDGEGLAEGGEPFQEVGAVDLLFCFGESRLRGVEQNERGLRPRIPRLL